jgi:hypothetical protein
MRTPMTADDDMPVGGMTAPLVIAEPSADPLEAAIALGAVRALHRRADAIRARASVGVTILDRRPAVRIVTSESARAFKIARDFDAITDDLEAEGSR